MDNAAKVVARNRPRYTLAWAKTPPIPPCRPLGPALALAACSWTERRERESDLVDHRFAVEAVTPGLVPPEGSVLDNASAVGTGPRGRAKVRSWNVN